MVISDMFQEDINRRINGVIKVDQNDDEVVWNEVSEYVITQELKKHFSAFFQFYEASFQEPTDEIGVWISGLFGSGKSHFLKMLSYLLSNRVVAGTKTVDCFQKKFFRSRAIYQSIVNSTRLPAETILFNIEIESVGDKKATSVLRVFAKMFYNHLGYYGEDLKVAMMERYIDKQGKTEEFRRIFQEKKGLSWVSQRRFFAFNGRYIVPALMTVLNMSEEDAQNWFHSRNVTEMSIALLVSDIKDYVDTKPSNFRLVFLVDEVGQFVGTDTGMLLNLQSLLEKIGSECGGKVWVVCTGQEALDEIINVRPDEFSRIQARFHTRLSLSSSSVDEVIQKRLLSKKPSTLRSLKAVYDREKASLRNLLTFSNAVQDLRGYSDPSDYAINYPFVPYQFILMQKVFVEIRRHGSTGKQISGGERSMLSSFQEVTQRNQRKNHLALVPFYHFYDAVQTILDSAIRNVVERCDRAARAHLGLERIDVDTLKLLYMIRYINDIPATLDNLVVLMADHIHMDKASMRQSISASLERLLSQNYISCSTSSIYCFLTDEEQDVQREINAFQVDSDSIRTTLANMLFEEIYPSRRCYLSGNIFPFDKMVDNRPIGSISGNMCLQFLTAAADPRDKSPVSLACTPSNQVTVILDETRYCEYLEKALKIRMYIRYQNVSQLPRSIQEIIHTQQEQASQYEAAAMTELTAAIENAAFWSDGEQLTLHRGDARFMLDHAMAYLVSHVYDQLKLLDTPGLTPADLSRIIVSQPGEVQSNRGAMAIVEEYLHTQARRHTITTLADLQRRFGSIPYGWRDLDISILVAMLMADQKVVLQRRGQTQDREDPRLPELLRRKTEAGRITVFLLQPISTVRMRQARAFARDYFDIMDVPTTENQLIAFLTDQFTTRLTYHRSILEHYQKRYYPDRHLVEESVCLLEDLLSQAGDHVAFTDRILTRQQELEESREDMQPVESFFSSQVEVYDAACQFAQDMEADREYIRRDPRADQALNRIHFIVAPKQEGSTTYSHIPELPGLMASVTASHNAMLEQKRAEILEIIRQCMEEIHSSAGVDANTQALSDTADEFFSTQKTRAAELQSLALLDGLIPPLWQYKDAVMDRMLPHLPINGPESHREVIRSLYRQALFPARTLKTEADVETYLNSIRTQLTLLLKDCDGIRLN